MKKIIGLSFFLLTLFTASAQQSVHNYKYVVVPNQFEFQDEPGKYQLNGLTKFLFEKYGFEAYLEGEVPEDLLNKPCEGLRANVLNESGMLTTKVKVTLTDCRNNVVFETEEGKSKEKDFNKSYNLATRDAFKDIEALNYHYQAPKGSAVLMQEEKVSEKKETPKAQATANVTAVSKEVKTDAPVGTLTAKSFGGVNYKVYDAEGTLVMTLLFTPKNDTFIVKGQDAILYKDDKGTWIHFSSDGGNMMAKGIDIKF